MEGISGMNDMSRVIEADRAHVWHHLIQHKQFETVDPRVIVRSWPLLLGALPGTLA